MVSPFVDIILFVGSYVCLFLLRRSLDGASGQPLFARILGFLAAWLALFSVCDWAFNSVSIIYRAATENVYLFYNALAMLLVDIVALRTALNPLPGFETPEVRDFMRESLLFHNYLRHRDAEFQEAYDRHIMKEIHRETSGTPFEEIVPAAEIPKPVRPVDVGSVPFAQSKEEHNAKKVRKLTEGLRKGEVFDATDTFRIALLVNEDHPHLRLLDEFTIDPRGRVFSMRLPLPDTYLVDKGNEKQMNDIVADLYLMLQVLQSLPWLQPFTPYFETIVLRVRHSEWNDLGTVTSRELLTFTIKLSDLRRHETNIMSGDAVRRIASIVVPTNP